MGPVRQHDRKFRGSQQSFQKKRPKFAQSPSMGLARIASPSLGPTRQNSDPWMPKSLLADETVKEEDMSDVGMQVMPTPRGTFEYEPLKDSSNEIRLLHLLPPGKDKNKIVCTLKPISLNESHLYTALSYTWESAESEPEHTIKILQYSKSTSHASLRDFHTSTFFIRPNLHAALLHLRDSVKTKVLWIDAICINQEDTEERNLQVSKMAEIYNRASNVSVWLGKATTESDMAMRFMNQVLDPSRYDLLLADESTIQKWHALLDLMHRPWFTRRWIIQEIMLARKATLHCGYETQDWSNFAGIVELIGDRRDQLTRIFANSPLHGEDTEILRNLETYGAYSLAQATRKLLLKSDDGRILNRRSTLEELILTLPAFKCGMPHDTVYALLSLASDIPSSISPLRPHFVYASQISVTDDPSPRRYAAIKVDYAKTVAEVFADVVKFYIQRTGKLDIICRYWAPEDVVDLPSWILPQSRKPKSPTQRYRSSGLKIPDSLVGPPNQRQYNAAGGHQTQAEFGFSTVQRVRENWTRTPGESQYAPQEKVEDLERFNGLLFVFGFRLNKILNIGPRLRIYHSV